MAEHCVHSQIIIVACFRKTVAMLLHHRHEFFFILCGGFLCPHGLGHMRPRSTGLCKP